MSAMMAQHNSNLRGRVKTVCNDMSEEIQSGVLVLNRSIDMTTLEIHYGCIGIDANLNAFRVCLCFPYYQHFKQKLPQIRVGGMYFIKGCGSTGCDGETTLFNPRYRPIADTKVRRRVVEYLSRDIHDRDLYYRFTHVDEDLKDHYDRSMLM